MRFAIEYLVKKLNAIGDVYLGRTVEYDSELVMKCGISECVLLLTDWLRCDTVYDSRVNVMRKCNIDE